MARLTLSAAKAQNIKSEEPKIDEVLQRGFETILNHKQRLAASKAASSKGGPNISDIKAGTEFTGVKNETGFNFNDDSTDAASKSLNNISSQYITDINRGVDPSNAFMGVQGDKNNLHNDVDLIGQTYIAAEKAINEIKENPYHTSENSQSILSGNASANDVEKFFLNRQYNQVGINNYSDSTPSGKGQRETYLNNRASMSELYSDGSNIDVDGVVKNFSLDNRKILNQNIVGDVDGTPIFSFGYTDLADVNNQWSSVAIKSILKQPNVMYKTYGEEDLNVIMSGMEEGSTTAIDVGSLQKYNLDSIRKYAGSEWNSFNQNNVGVRSGYNQKDFVNDIILDFQAMNLKADNTLRILASRVSTKDAKRLLNIKGTYSMFQHGLVIANTGVKDWWGTRRELGMYDQNGNAIPLPDWNSFVDGIESTQLTESSTISADRPGVQEAYNSVFAIGRNKISKGKDNQYLIYDMMPASGESIRKVSQGGYNLSTLYFPDNLDLSVKEGSDEKVVSAYDDTQFFNQNQATGSNLVPWSKYSDEVDIQTYGSGASAQTSLPGDVVSVRSAYALYNPDGTFNKILDKKTYDGARDAFSQSKKGGGGELQTMFNNVKPIIVEGVRFNNVLKNDSNGQAYANPNFESNFIYAYNIKPFNMANSMSLQNDYADLDKIAQTNMDRLSTQEFSDMNEEKGNKTSSQTSNNYTQFLTE